MCHKGKSIILFHPFSASAIGMTKKDLLFSHSQPHVLALKTIQKKGIKVFVDYFDTSLLPNKESIGDLRKRFWPVTNLIKKPRSRWRKEFSFWHLCHTYFFAADLTVINMSGNLSPYTYRFAKLLQKLGKPYIAMLGGVHVGSGNADLKYYQKAHHIIVHTEIQKRTLKQNSGFEYLDIVVMPLGVDTTIFKPDNKRIDQSTKLLYVGRISRLKQIEIAIKAVAYCITKGISQLQLEIVGPISDYDYYKELTNLVNTLKLEEYVSFKGALVHSELITYYQQAHMLLLPSAHESFGMVIIEAMSCGTPVIALKGAGGPDEIIVNGRNGVLCDKTIFSEKVFEHLDTEQQMLLSVQSRKDVIEKWSIEVTVSVFQQSVNKVFQI